MDDNQVSFVKLSIKQWKIYVENKCITLFLYSAQITCLGNSSSDFIDNNEIYCKFWPVMFGSVITIVFKIC